MKAEKAVTLIRLTVEDLIAKCKEIVEREGERIDDEEYVNDADPSILRFLLASREEVLLCFLELISKTWPFDNCKLKLRLICAVVFAGVKRAVTRRSSLNACCRS